MVLQLEDCVDVLKWMYPDFDFIFLFDHSNGHDQIQPGISICFGGQQPCMRDTLLNSPTMFGPFHTPNHELQLGMM